MATRRRHCRASCVVSCDSGGGYSTSPLVHASSLVIQVVATRRRHCRGSCVVSSCESYCRTRNFLLVSGRPLNSTRVSRTPCPPSSRTLATAPDTSVGPCLSVYRARVPRYWPRLLVSLHVVYSLSFPFRNTYFAA